MWHFFFQYSWQTQGVYLPRPVFSSWSLHLFLLACVGQSILLNPIHKIHQQFPLEDSSRSLLPNNKPLRVTRTHKLINHNGVMFQRQSTCKLFKCKELILCLRDRTASLSNISKGISFSNISIDFNRVHIWSEIFYFASKKVFVKIKHIDKGVNTTVD